MSDSVSRNPIVRHPNPLCQPPPATLIPPGPGQDPLHGRRRRAPGTLEGILAKARAAARESEAARRARDLQRSKATVRNTAVLSRGPASTLPPPRRCVRGTQTYPLQGCPGPKGSGFLTVESRPIRPEAFLLLTPPAYLFVRFFFGAGRRVGTH